MCVVSSCMTLRRCSTIRPAWSRPGESSARIAATRPAERMHVPGAQFDREQVFIANDDHHRNTVVDDRFDALRPTFGSVRSDEPPARTTPGSSDIGARSRPANSRSRATGSIDLGRAASADAPPNGSALRPMRTNHAASPAEPDGGDRAIGSGKSKVKIGLTRQMPRSFCRQRRLRLIGRRQHTARRGRRSDGSSGLIRRHRISDIVERLDESASRVTRPPAAPRCRRCR